MLFALLGTYAGRNSLPSPMAIIPWMLNDETI